MSASTGRQVLLELFEFGRDFSAAQLLAQRLIEAQRHIRALAQEVDNQLGGDVAILARHGGVVGVKSAQTQYLGHDVREEMAHFGLQEVVGQRGVVMSGAPLYSVAPEQQQVALEVVGDDGQLLARQQWRQLADALQRQPGGAVRPHGHGGANQTGGHRLGADGIKRQADAVGPERLGEYLIDVGSIVCLRHGLLRLIRDGVEVEERAHSVGGISRRRLCGDSSRRGELGNERAELQLLINLAQRAVVRLAAAQVIGIDVEAEVGADCGKIFRQDYLLAVVLDLGAQRALDFGCALKHILDGAELADELHGGFLADARTAGNVVGRVAFERQQIHDLTGTVNAVTLAYLPRPAHLEALAFQRGAIHEYGVGHELAIVLVGRHHIRDEAAVGGAVSQRADDVVGLISGQLHDGNAHRLQHPLDIRNRQGYVLGLLVAPGLIVGKHIVAERMAADGVEADGQMRRILLAHQVVESVYESEYGRGVESAGGYARIAEKRVVGTINQRVCVKQKQFLFSHGSES